jgi:hypothetical protein
LITTCSKAKWLKAPSGRILATDGFDSKKQHPFELYSGEPWARTDVRCDERGEIWQDILPTTRRHQAVCRSAGESMKVQIVPIWYLRPHPNFMCRNIWGPPVRKNRVSRSPATTRKMMLRIVVSIAE